MSDLVCMYACKHCIGNNVNSQTGSGGILSGLGIADYFDFVLTSREVHSAKPDPKLA